MNPNSNDIEYEAYLSYKQYCGNNPNVSLKKTLYECFSQRCHVDEKSKKIKKMETTFEHKYNLGDTVWIMGDNAPTKGIVTSINYIVSMDYEDIRDGLTSKKDTTIEYDVENDNFADTFEETEIFSSKKELINSL